MIEQIERELRKRFQRYGVSAALVEMGGELVSFGDTEMLPLMRQVKVIHEAAPGRDDNIVVYVNSRYGLWSDRPRMVLRSCREEEKALVIAYMASDPIAKSMRRMTRRFLEKLDSMSDNSSHLSSAGIGGGL